MSHLDSKYKITIIRKKELNNRLRKISLIINSDKKEKVTFKERSFYLKGNPEVNLKAKIDWCYSPELKLLFNDNNQHKKVIISSQISDGYIIALFILV